MKPNVFLAVLIGTSFALSNLFAKTDVTIMGQMRFADSLAGIAANIMHSLKNEVSMNFISTTNTIDFKNMPNDVQNIISSSYYKDNTQKTGRVILYTDIIWYTRAGKIINSADFLPQDKNIAIAYSMLESDKIPDEWVNVLNNSFDAVVVPDEFLISVYQKCGVNIPIFVIPCGLYLNDFLERKPKEHKSSVFTFGMSALGLPHKNFDLLLQAFHEEFKNDKDVKLKLHTRRADVNFIKKIRGLIRKNSAKNIILINKYLSRSQYIDFLSSLDCYVLVSKGEGFSNTPREASALGIPCIISNNTAHTTICKTDLVKSVESPIEEPAFYGHLGYSGNYRNCKMDDVRKALRDVYNNYSFYLEKAKRARIWVQEYSNENLKPYYKNLVLPTKLFLGTKNEIGPDYLMTNSEALYKKYKGFFKKSE